MATRTVRGNRFVELPVCPTLTAAAADPAWTAEDRARLTTLRARWPTDPADLLLCAVWKKKVPGLQYDPVIETQLAMRFNA
jgi:hypothetical protein